MVSNNLLDDTSLLQILEATAGKGAVNLQTIDQHSDGDESVGLDILVELLGNGLVEDDGVLGLILNYSKFSVIALISSQRRIPYPFPWTTSSSASFLQLLRGPNFRNSVRKP